MCDKVLCGANSTRITTDVQDSFLSIFPPVSGILGGLLRPLCPPIGADMGGRMEPRDPPPSWTVVLGDDVALTDEECNAQDAHPDGECQSDWFGQDRDEEHHQRDAIAEVGQPPAEGIAS